jgi:membrane fusion protein, multidrug efflux system
LLLAALPIGYLYCNYTTRFESTEDAYIAARQFAIAPEVSGYLTAVSVTDNEHVNAGGVIARIDDRTYRAALAQAEAQVAAAQASIKNVDAQMNVQQAQIASDQAQLDRARAALVFAQQQAARYQYLAKTQLAGSVQNAQQYTSQFRQQQFAVE